MANLRNDPTQKPGQQQPKNPAFNKKGFQKDAANLPDMDADAKTRNAGSSDTSVEEDFSGGAEGDSMRQSSNEGTGSDRRDKSGLTDKSGASSSSKKDLRH